MAMHYFKPFFQNLFKIWSAAHKHEFSIKIFKKFELYIKYFIKEFLLK